MTNNQNDEDDGQPTLYLPPKWYDIFKYFVMVLLPALATFYLTLGDLWNFPGEATVPAFITALTLFLGIILRSSKKRYDQSSARFGGTIDLTLNDEGQVVLATGFKESLLDKLPNKSEVTLKVDSKLPPGFEG